MTRRIVRVVHRVSDRVCLEHRVPADDLSRWLKGIEPHWDSVIFKIEIADMLEGNDS